MYSTHAKSLRSDYIIKGECDSSRDGQALPPVRSHTGGSSGVHLHKRPHSVHEQDLKNMLLSTPPGKATDFMDVILSTRCSRPLSYHEHVFVNGVPISLLPAQSDQVDFSLIPRPVPLRGPPVNLSAAAVGSGAEQEQPKPPQLKQDELQYVTSRDREQLHEEMHKTKMKLELSSGGGLTHSARREREPKMDAPHGTKRSAHAVAPNSHLGGLPGTPPPPPPPVNTHPTHGTNVSLDTSPFVAHSAGSSSLKGDGGATTAGGGSTLAGVPVSGKGDFSTVGRLREEVLVQHSPEKPRHVRELENHAHARDKESSRDTKELLRQQELSQSSLSESGSSEAINMFSAEFDSRKVDADRRKEAKLEKLHESNSKLAKENSVLSASLFELKQHVTSQIQMSHKQLDSVKSERDQARHDLEQQRQRLHRALAERDETLRELRRLAAENKSHKDAYDLVMSERESVLKEIDKLEGRLEADDVCVERLTKENKRMSEELETLRREIKSALQERDHAIKELSELKEQPGGEEAEGECVGGGGSSSTASGTGRGAVDSEQRRLVERASRDGSDASGKDIATARELDGLRREVERIKAELSESQNEVEVAKNRRDWAFSERDKIVRERESIRTLCDKLRRERDSAVSQFMSAVKDSDELKQSRAEAQRLAKEYKEKYEALLEKESSSDVNDCESYHRSTDSAIDSDMSEYHAETIHIDLGSHEDLGFELGSSRDDNAVVVRNLTPGTPASNKLRLNDTVLKVNNMDVSVHNSDAVLARARHSGVQVVVVTVRRKRLLGIHGVKPIVLNLTEDSDPGLKIEGGLYISNIAPGSPAAREGTLAVGDRIVAINGSSVDNLAPRDAMKRMKESRSLVSLHVMKFTISQMLSSSKSLKSSSSLSSNIMNFDEGSHNVMTSSTGGGAGDLLSKSPMVSQRSNGSQTDSLDSPPPPLSPRHSAHSSMLTSPTQSIQTGTRSGHKEEGKGQNRFARVFSAAIPRLLHTDRSERSSRSKSMYTDVLDAHPDTLDEPVPRPVAQVEPIRELSVTDTSASVKYDLVPESDTGGTLRAGNGGKEVTSGGTWPRRHAMPEYLSSFVVPKRRQRPALNDFTYIAPEHAASSTATGSSQHGMWLSGPPDPPVRKDSFHNDLIIKHSPQNSDSTLKGFQIQTSNLPPSSPNKIYSASPDNGAPSPISSLSRDSAPEFFESPTHPLLPGNVPASVLRPNLALQAQHVSYKPFEMRHMRNDDSNGRRGGTGSTIMTTSLPAGHTGLPAGSGSGVGVSAASPHLQQSYGRPPSSASASFANTGPSPPPGLISISSVDSSLSQDHAAAMSSLRGNMPRPTPMRPVLVNKGRKERLSQSRPVAGSRTYSSKPGYLDLTPMFPPTQRRTVQTTPQQPVPQQPSHGLYQEGVLSTGSLQSPQGPNVSQSSARFPPGNTSLAAMATRESPAQYVPAIIRHSSSGPGSSGFSTGCAIQAASPVNLPASHGASPVFLHTSQHHAAAAAAFAHSTPQPFMHTSQSYAQQYMHTSPLTGLSSRNQSVGAPPYVMTSSSGSNSSAQNGSGGGSRPPPSSVPGLLGAPPISAAPHVSGHPFSPLPPGYRPASIEEGWAHVGGHSAAAAGGGHYRQRPRLARNTTPSPSPSLNSTVPSENEFPSFRSHGEPGHYRADCQRICFPSKMSNSSLSDGPSPCPNSPFHPDSGNMYAYQQRPIARPKEMEKRDICIEKTGEEIGIQIEKGKEGGIFMSHISENSPAAKAGLFVGDQILEICGLNMRNALYEQVATVLRQVTGSITLKVQYNPPSRWKASWNQNSADSTDDFDSADDSISPSPPAPPGNTQTGSGQTAPGPAILALRSPPSPSSSPGVPPPPPPAPGGGTAELVALHQRSNSQRSSQRSQRSASLNSPESRNSSQRSSLIQRESGPGGEQDTLPQMHVRSGSGRSNSQSQRSGSGRSSGRSNHGNSNHANNNMSADNYGSMRREHSGRSKKEEERLVYYEKRGGSLDEYIGFDLLGGNAMGHFVHHVASNGPACGPGGLQVGDQILQLNGVSLNGLTAEQAEQELRKPCESVAALAQYRPHKYSKVLAQRHCDSLYVRCLWDYTPTESDGHLAFKRGDILYVDNTAYDGMAGLWRAWRLDEQGSKVQCGTVPGKNGIEDEFVLRRSTSDAGDDVIGQDGGGRASGSRRGSTSARRSFFRRKPKHARNNSKDSRELSSYSDVSISSDMLPCIEDGRLLTYERVERPESCVYRPVVILSPLAEPLINKITSESPDKYQFCKPERTMGIPLDRDDSSYIDMKANDGHFECIHITTVREAMANNRHCMLQIQPDDIEKLHRLQIYPIVILIKHDSPKQIREVKDSRFLPEKMSSKQAKELFQQFSEYEKKYKHLFSEIIMGGSLALMYYRTKQCIDAEQSKTMWVPAGSL